MPKNVLKPEEFQDCREEYLEGLGARDNTKIVLIGTQGDTEARKPRKRKNAIGREFHDHETLSLCYAKLKNLQQEGQYNYLIGRVLYPDRRREEWSKSKNQAFIAGVIAAKRPVLLVTPIENYTGYPTGTVNELMWLDKAGYKFIRDKSHPTKIWVYPPSELKSVEIADYSNDTELSTYEFKRILRQNNIRFFSIPVPAEIAELEFVIKNDRFFYDLYIGTCKANSIKIVTGSTEEKEVFPSLISSSSSSSSLSSSSSILSSSSSSSSSSSQSSSSSSQAQLLQAMRQEKGFLDYQEHEQKMIEAAVLASIKTAIFEDERRRAKPVKQILQEHQEEIYQKLLSSNPQLAARFAQSIGISMPSVPLSVSSSNASARSSSSSSSSSPSSSVKSSSSSSSSSSAFSYSMIAAPSQAFQQDRRVQKTTDELLAEQKIGPSGRTSFSSSSLFSATSSTLTAQQAQQKKQGKEKPTIPQSSPASSSSSTPSSSLS